MRRKQLHLRSIDELAEECYIYLNGAGSDSTIHQRELSKFIGPAMSWAQHRPWAGSTKKLVVLRALALIVERHVPDEEQATARIFLQYEADNLIDGIVLLAKGKEFVRSSGCRIL